MQITSEALERAIEELARLPGTGRKSAQRMAIHLLKQSDERVLKLADALVQLKKSVQRCSVCGNITDHDPCAICSNVKRKTGVVCVVEEFQDVFIIEKTNEFRGRYHVLGGVISPLENIGPDDIRIKQLLERIGGSDAEGEQDEQIEEVILALNPDAEGEATSYYINKLLLNYDVDVTRIAYGIPMGTELEFIDEATLSRAFASRASF
jgi:recombination protein RecR